MPRKWIIFQVIAGLAILASILMIGVILLPHPNKSQNDSGRIISSIVVFGFITVMSFALLYTFILQSKFPDKSVSLFLRISFMATGIISILFLLICVIGLGTIINDNIKYSQKTGGNKELYIAISTECLCLIIMISFICSLRLTKIISRAHLIAENAAIEALGNIVP